MTYSSKEDVVQAGEEIVACLNGYVENEGLFAAVQKICFQSCDWKHVCSGSDPTTNLMPLIKNI